MGKNYDDKMNEFTWNLVRKSFLNQVDWQEEEQLLNWLDNSAENRVLYNSLREIWETTDNLRIIFS